MSRSLADRERIRRALARVGLAIEPRYIAGIVVPVVVKVRP